MVIVPRYALIIDGIVANVIEADYQNANKIADLQNAKAINVDQYPVQPNDTYQDLIFYRGEVEIKRIPTEAEIIAMQQQEINTQNEYLIDLDFRQSLSELGV